MGSRRKVNPTPLDKANRELRDLKKEHEKLKKRLEEVEADQKRYQGFFKSDFISQLNCMRENKYYSPEAVIKKYTQLLNSCERFYLGF